MKRRTFRTLIKHRDVEDHSKDGFNSFLCSTVYHCKCERCFIPNCSHRMKLLVTVGGVTVDI